ncbi:MULTISPECIES: hypothetical protein [Citrobacter]|uniref:hypothetical protein n=1 Tax=Citrobacter TaxID=544 RepID=UPI001900DA0C|nr:MULTISPECIES: hypothetical protein [Citrobacter]MBJ9134413.1 hypothetical protein [Citrobacter farmeri]MDM2738404.1 hypothetical protein [Citrobacter sp. Ct235]
MNIKQYNHPKKNAIIYRGWTDEDEFIIHYTDTNKKVYFKDFYTRPMTERQYDSMYTIMCLTYEQLFGEAAKRNKVEEIPDLKSMSEEELYELNSTAKYDVYKIVEIMNQIEQVK